MIMMKTILFTCALLVGTLSWAAGSGTSIGNGGVGIMENGKLYMLDLFEYSVHDRPVFGIEPVVHWLPKKIEQLFPGLNLSRNVQDRFAQKLSDVMRKDYYFGQTMMVAIENLDWRLVNSGLVRLNDDQAAMNPNNLVQIAIRQKFVVFIDRDKWQMLNDDNKVALLIHEVLYVLTENQNAIDARNVTGALFTQQFLTSGYSRNLLNAVKSLALNSYPMKYEDALFPRKGDVSLPIYQVSYYFEIKRVDSKPLLKFVSSKEYCIQKAKERAVNITAPIGIELSSVFFTAALREVDNYTLVRAPSYRIDVSGQRGTVFAWKYPIGKAGKTCESDYLRAMQEIQNNLERDFAYYP
jgi:hypothetical protein